MYVQQLRACKCTVACQLPQGMHGITRTKTVSLPNPPSVPPWVTWTTPSYRRSSTSRLPRPRPMLRLLHRTTGHTHNPLAQRVSSMVYSWCNVVLGTLVLGSCLHWIAVIISVCYRSMQLFHFWHDIHVRGTCTCIQACFVVHQDSHTLYIHTDMQCVNKVMYM